MFARISAAMCRVLGHKDISSLNGVIKCRRCHRAVYPVDGSRTLYSMKKHDPEWARIYGSKPVRVALAAFRDRNPTYGATSDG